MFYNLVRVCLAVVCLTSCWSADDTSPVTRTWKRGEWQQPPRPSLVVQVAQESSDKSEHSTTENNRSSMPDHGLSLERRDRTRALLERVATGGVDELTPEEQEQFIALMGSELLLLPEEAGEPFRRLCVRALAKLQRPGWWTRDAERRVILVLVDVVAQAHVAGGKEFLDAFDNVGVFELAAHAALSELHAAMPLVTTFADLDRIDIIARQAFSILAAAGRAPTSTYQETPVYAALIRRREALRP